MKSYKALTLSPNRNPNPAADTESSMRLPMALVSNCLARQAVVQPLLGCRIPSDVAVPNTEHILYD